jgi:hypothetical protein
MTETSLLLRAYYETLYERLSDSRKRLIQFIEAHLPVELAARRFRGYTEQKYAAYEEACLAFVDERLEAYNPIGIQYTFGQACSKTAAQLELQLDWFDSRAEFGALCQAAQSKAEQDMTDARLRELAGELIQEMGAFPNRSIIQTYEASPALNRVPDYIVAQAFANVTCLPPGSLGDLDQTG